MTFKRTCPNGYALVTVAMELNLPVSWDTTGTDMEIRVDIPERDVTALVQLEIAELFAHSRPR